MKIKALQSSFFVAVLLLLAWLPVSSFAAGVAAPSAFDAFMWTVTGGQSQTVGFGSNGTPIATPSPPMIDTDGGLPRVTQSGTLKNPSGNPFTVTAAGRVSALNTAKAVGRVISSVVGPLAVGVAVYDLIKELGFNATGSASGVVIQAEASGACTANCYEYTQTVSGATSGWVSSAVAACNGVVGGYMYSNLILSAESSVWYSGSAGACRYTFPNGVVSAWYSLGVRAIAPHPVVYRDVSMQEFTDAVAAKSGWPSTSNISRVLAEPAASQDQKIQVEPVVLTGPATSLGKLTVTNNATNNTTRTETVTHNHTYTGANVQTTTVTNTTVINNVDNSVVEQITKTDSPQLPAIEPCGLPGQPVCAVKVDESGMPQTIAKTEYEPLTDQVKTSKDSALGRMRASGDTSAMFSGWSAFFGTPAIATCAPIVLPQFKGVSMGSLDPCPVVDGMREVMAYLWAAGGLFLCLGMIRQTVQGG